MDSKMPERRWTSPQYVLLNELELGKWIKKAGINKKADASNRSGNLETPAKNPRHRKFMGQDPEGRGSRSDKPGRPDSNPRAKPTSMDDPTGLENLGEPYKHGLSSLMGPDGTGFGDDASGHPSQRYKPTRLQGPSETPGKQTWTSFGNRYPK